jgi:hypothetical protein
MHSAEKKRMKIKWELVVAIIATIVAILSFVVQLQERADRIRAEAIAAQEKARADQLAEDNRALQARIDGIKLDLGKFGDEYRGLLQNAQGAVRRWEDADLTLQRTQPNERAYVAEQKEKARVEMEAIGRSIVSLVADWKRVLEELNKFLNDPNIAQINRALTPPPDDQQLRDILRALELSADGKLKAMEAELERMKRTR